MIESTTDYLSERARFPKDTFKGDILYDIPEDTRQQGYETLDADQTADYRIKSLNEKTARVLKSDISEEDKAAVLSDVNESITNIIAHNDLPLEQPWVDPIDAMSGVSGFSKIASKAFGAVTFGKLTGKGVLKFSDGTFTKALVAALATEAPIGQAMDIIDEKLIEEDVPWYLKLPITLGTGIAVGGYAQIKAENAIDAITDSIRKAGTKISSGQVRKAVKVAKANIEEEISLVTDIKKYHKRPKKRDRIADLKTPKESKTTFRQEIKDKKAALDPLFVDEIPNVNKNYADLKQVKKAAKEFFDDTFQEAEAIEEFMIQKASARKLVGKLKDEGFEGVAEEGYAKKFYGDAKPKVNADKELLVRAKAHAGASTVTGMTGGIFAGLEVDEEGKVTGFNPTRALAVGLASAVGGAYSLKNYSKFIAGVKGMTDLPKKALDAEAKLLKDTAYKLDIMGTPPLKTAMGTGWYKGIEGKWRKYVPNEGMQLKPMSAKEKAEWRQGASKTIGDLISFPEMEKYYGNTVLKNTKVVYTPNPFGKSLAGFDQSNDTIYIYTAVDKKQLLNSILHETVHAIQKEEGFSAGTNSETMGYVFDQATRTLGIPVSSRTVEQGELLKSFGDSLKQLDIVTQKDIKTKLKNSAHHLLNRQITKGMIESEDARELFKNAAYWASYGEVEARIGASIKPTGQIKTLTDLSQLTDPKMWIETESLIVPMWDVLGSQQTRDALNASLKLSHQMKKKGINPSVVQRWEGFANKRIIEPFQHWVDSKIYSERLREQFGINLPKKYRALLEDYDRQANRILDHTMSIAKELDDLAPTQKEQKRLYQILRGGVTSDPQLAQAAKKVQGLFKELRENTKEIGLRSYDMYDAYTKTERSQLKTVIRTSSNPDKVIAAQEALKNHYRAGTSYEYIPLALKSKEGVSGTQRKALNKRLNKLKALAREATDIIDDEPLPHLRDEIDELQGILAVNNSNAFNTNRKQLTQGYANITSPAEANDILFKTEQGIQSASFSAAQGLSEQAIDLQRNSFLKAIANNQDWALPKDTAPEFIPQHFSQLKGKRYGELNGMYVDKVIAKDINDLGDVTNSFIRNYDKILGLWKLGKAVYNPATHAGNFTSNMFLAYLNGGVLPSDVKTYSQAAQAIRSRMNNKWFKEAEGWGLLNNTFSAAELSQFRKSLASFREHPKSVTTGQKVKKTLERYMNYPSAMYEKSEQFFKMAVFISKRKEGQSIDAAARKAEESLFNYRDIPPIVRHYKRWASPFFTFTYKNTGTTLSKSVIRYPHRFALMGGAYMAWQKFAEYNTDTTPEQVAQERKNMPNMGKFDMLLPWKDEDGNRMYWDISRLVPLGQYSEKWGQTGLPLGSFAPTANPFAAVAYELAANKDIFTGQEVYNTDIDGLIALLGKSAAHIYKEMTPSLTPGNYSYNNLVKGVKSLNRDIIDFTGQEVTMQDMIARSIFAVKVSSATKRAMFRSFKGEVMRIDRGIGKRLNSYKTKYRRNEISGEEYKEAVNVLVKQKRFLKENIYDRMKEGK